MNLRNLIFMGTAAIILGCGGAGRPYVPAGNGGTGGGGGTTTFSISLTDEVGTTITVGETGELHFQVIAVDSQTESPAAAVHLTVTGQPGDSNVTISPNDFTPNFSGTPVTVTIATQPQAGKPGSAAKAQTDPGIYTITLHGSDGTHTAEASGQLQVDQFAVKPAR